MTVKVYSVGCTVRLGTKPKVDEMVRFPLWSPTEAAHEEISLLPVLLGAHYISAYPIVGRSLVPRDSPPVVRANRRENDDLVQLVLCR